MCIGFHGYYSTFLVFTLIALNSINEMLLAWLGKDDLLHLLEYDQHRSDIDYVIVFHWFQISVLILILDCYTSVDLLTTVG